MGESWMVDGETSVMMMTMISSNFPSRQGARMEFLVPNWSFTFSGDELDYFDASLPMTLPSFICMNNIFSIAT
jgi:hypothetical protein